MQRLVVPSTWRGLHQDRQRSDTARWQGCLSANGSYALIRSQNVLNEGFRRACLPGCPRILPARVNQHVAIIRPDSQDSIPASYAIVSSISRCRPTLLSWAAFGGTRNAFDQGDDRGHRGKVSAAVSEQRAIVHILDTLDNKIELNRRVDGTLEAMAWVTQPGYVLLGRRRTRVFREQWRGPTACESVSRH